MPAPAAPAGEAQPNATPDTPQATLPDAIVDKTNAVQRLVAKYAKKQAAKEAPKATEAPATPAAAPEAPAEAAPAQETTPASVEAAKDKVEAAGGEVPDQRAGESDAQYELRLARMANDLRRAQAESVTFKQKATELERKSAEAEKRIAEYAERAKKNPLRLIEELYGAPLKDIMQKAADGAFDEAPTAQLPPEVQRELDALKQWREEQEKQETARREAASRAADLEKVSAWVAENADEFSVAASDIPGVKEALLERAYAHLRETGQQPDMAAIAKEFEGHIHGQLKQLLTADRVVKRVLSDPELRAKITTALGVQPSNEPRTAAPASRQRGNTAEEGPRSVPNAASTEAPLSPNRPRTEADEKAESLRLWRLARERAAAANQRG